MGEFKFRLPEHWKPSDGQAKSIHVVGLDGIPSPCRVSLTDDGLLRIVRNQDESGKVFLSWFFEEVGELTVATGTLPESATPYNLVVELARGVLNRLRNQISIWQEGGLDFSKDIFDLVAKATSLLSRAIMESDRNASDQGANEALNIAMLANLKVSQHFGREVSAYRTTEPEMPRLSLIHI